MSQTDVDKVEGKIIALAQKRPVFYADILKELHDEDYRTIMLAFGRIRQKRLFGRDEKGRYIATKGAEIAGGEKKT